MILEIIPCGSSSNIRKSEVRRGPTRSNDRAIKGAQIQPYKDVGGLGWTPVSPAKVPYFSLDLKI